MMVLFYSQTGISVVLFENPGISRCLNMFSVESLSLFHLKSYPFVCFLCGVIDGLGNLHADQIYKPLQRQRERIWI